MKCIFLPSGKTCIKDRNGTFHCISVIHPVQPYRECPFLLNEECSPDTTVLSVYLRHNYGEESIVQPKRLLCCIRNVLTAIPTVIDTRIFVIGLVICCLRRFAYSL